jgi:L-ascorbate metabolism protein UlaG (beta-lactamase superfamily)
LNTDLPAINLLESDDPPIGTTGSLMFVGTATVIVEIAGFRFMTDPNFLHQGEHAYLGLGLRSRRLTDPAIELDALPALDFVVLSHHHGDHFDQRVAADLRRDIPIITEPGSARKLREQQFRRVVALDTWQTQTVTRGDAWITITATPAKHAPQPLQALLPKVMGSILEIGWGGRARYRMYITGDTLMYDGIKQIAERYPDIDLCVIHLGGTRIAGVLLTMDAAQGISALRVVQPKVAVPIHNDDYTVFTSSVDDFRSAVAAADLTTEVRFLERGETYTFDVVER